MKGEGMGLNQLKGVDKVAAVGFARTTTFRSYFGTFILLDFVFVLKSTHSALLGAPMCNHSLLQPKRCNHHHSKNQTGPKNDKPIRLYQHKRTPPIIHPFLLTQTL